MSNFVNADQIIGRMHSVTEEAAALIDHVEAEYFTGETATEEALLKIRTEYSKAGKMLRAALELLHLAEQENISWQNRPAEQIKGEQ